MLGDTKITDVAIKSEVFVESSMGDRHKYYTEIQQNVVFSIIEGVCAQNVGGSLGVCQRLPGRRGDCLAPFSKKYEFAVETADNGIQDRARYMQTQNP